MLPVDELRRLVDRLPDAVGLPLPLALALLDVIAGIEFLFSFEDTRDGKFDDKTLLKAAVHVRLAYPRYPIRGILLVLSII